MASTKRLLGHLERLLRTEYQANDPGVAVSIDANGGGISGGRLDPYTALVDIHPDLGRSSIRILYTVQASNDLQILQGIESDLSRYRTATETLVERGYRPEVSIAPQDVLLSAKYVVSAGPFGILRRSLAEIVALYGT